MLTEQVEARAAVAELVDAEEWRVDKRRAWTAILFQLVCAMDWETGLVTAVTADRLGAAGDRAPRTVSRVMAWAREAGLVVVVEHAASAEFLGTDHGRTPTYALVTGRPLPAPSAGAAQGSESTSAQLKILVDENGDLPKSLVENNPLNGRRLEHPDTSKHHWPLFQIPKHGPERTEATRRVLHRLGLQPGGRCPIPLWRARALLCWWWHAGGSPAGLLWAIDHHPDRPDRDRGDALRGARDPLRVLGHRLAPWRGRVRELPAPVTGLRGNWTERTRQPTASGPAGATPMVMEPAPSTAATRVAAQAALAEHLAQLRLRRT
ncbi:hypothetical protein [Pseudonocardia sp. KRD291]|uniref:hypothetical protein n=1 Tax=Pseudonocardia sp. KRD291 TaxID=2792007 RepID=UPI001C4A4D01|nr:hypothetical protein [Pseudonocardia sp. KRD291]MBW0105804.1 hypothetical protein [Pseudonocardia sp. KRD291]